MSADQPTQNDRGSTASSLTPLADGDTTRPDWARGFDHVVVQAGITDKQHKPDLTADEPQPACGAPDPAGEDWRAVEKDENVALCRHQSCWGRAPYRDGGAPQRAINAASDPGQTDLDRWSQ